MKYPVLGIIFAFTAISALYTVLTPNLVRSVFGLFFTLFGVGACYAFLGADFLAVVQVLLYVGGIAVLILFAVMLSKNPYRPGIFGSKKRTISAGLISLLIFLTISYFISQIPSPGISSRSIPLTSEIGGNLLTNYLLQFEIVSVLLLCVLIGAAFIIRKEIKND
jgi:NADH-quinone oxidoreductase subunit J